MRPIFPILIPKNPFGFRSQAKEHIEKVLPQVLGDLMSRNNATPGNKTTQQRCRRWLFTSVTQALYYYQRLPRSDTLPLATLAVLCCGTGKQPDCFRDTGGTAPLTTVVVQYYNTKGKPISVCDAVTSYRSARLRLNE